MAGPEDLIARVAISGQDDVISALGEIGKAGEEAFKRLADSAGTIAGGLVGVGLAVTGVAAAVGLLAESGARATQAIANIAATTGDSVENVSALQGALASVGGSTESLGLAFRRLGLEVTRTWDQISKEVKERSDVIAGSQLKAREATLALTTAQQTLRTAAQTIGGGPLPGAAAVAQSPFQAQQQQRAEAEDKYKQAVLARSEAVRAANEAQRNDIVNVVEAIGKVIAGEETLAQTATKINPTLENVWKGIIGNSGDAADAIKNFNGDFSQLATAGPKVTEVLTRSAEFFKNSGDAALNAGIGLREFGRGSGTLVSALTQLGGTGLQELTQHFKDLGFETTSLDKQIAGNFNKTLFSLQTELNALKEQISTPFQAALTPGLSTFQKFIEDNRKAIVDFATDLAAKVKPAIDDFFAIISGKQATQTTWVQPLVNDLKAVGSAALEAAKDIGTLLSQAQEVGKNTGLTEISDLLNKVSNIASHVFPQNKEVQEAVSGIPGAPGHPATFSDRFGAAPPIPPSPEAIPPPGSVTAPAATSSGFSPPASANFRVAPPPSAPTSFNPPASANFATAPSTPVPVVITGTTGAAAGPQVAPQSQAVPTPQPVPEIAGDFAALDDEVKSVSAALPDLLSGLTQLASALATAASSVGTASQGKAEGGVVSGPGGPKDDKVPIMASAGEYVVTADGSNLHQAIEHFGGGGQQSFAQRTGITTNLGHVKDRIQYALGGLVEAFQRPIAHYAVGGPVRASASSASTGPPIHFYMDNQLVGTGRADNANTGRAISRLAVSKGISSGYSSGKSSWYRGS